MSELLQPDNDALAEIWLKLDESDRQSLYGVLPADVRQKINTFNRDLAKEEVVQARLKEDVPVELYRRRLKKETDRQERRQSTGAHSWEWVDLDEYWDKPQQIPEVGAFAGTGGIFYKGKVNEVHGGSESGKTMFVLAVAAQEIKAGNTVVMYDYEDDPGAITGRLRHAFGLTREEVKKFFRYANPLIGMEDEDLKRLSELDNPTMCIIDAVTESMAIDNLKGRDETEVAQWYHSFPKRVAALDLAVVLIDHTSKENFSASIGSQHKKSAVTGVSYTAEGIHTFVKGELGRLRLRIAKDKVGSIRPAAATGAEAKDGQRWRGDFVLDSRGSIPTWRVEPWDAEFVPANAADGELQKLPSITAIQLFYLQGIAAYEENGSGPSDLRERLQSTPAPDGHIVTRQSPGNQMADLKRKGLTEKHPKEKGKWRITPLGVSVIANAEINKAAVEQKFLDHSTPRRASSRPVHEPAGQGILNRDEPE